MSGQLGESHKLVADTTRTDFGLLRQRHRICMRLGVTVILGLGSTGGSTTMPCVWAITPVGWVILALFLLALILILILPSKMDYENGCRSLSPRHQAAADPALLSSSQMRAASVQVRAGPS